MVCSGALTMASLGGILRSARLEQGLSLPEIASRTRISSSYLAAIEADDLKPLPGGFFYKSFVRQYAGALGLDEGQFEFEIANVLENEEEPKVPGQGLDPYVQDVPPLRGHSNPGPRLFRTFAIFLGMIVVCSRFYAWWHTTESAAPSSPPVEQNSQVVTVPTPNPIAEPAVKHETTAVPHKAMMERPLATNTAIHINVAATERTWLSITSDGKRLFSGVLKPRQTKTLEGKETARLGVANAAGLKVKWNGKAIGPIGSRGQERIVLFTRNNFKIVAAN